MEQGIITEAALTAAFCCVSPPDNELLYRERDGDVVRYNVDTKVEKVVVPNQLFVSIMSQHVLHELQSLPLLHWMHKLVFLHPIQDRSKAAKYQVSPDMQHVLFAFEVKPVRKSAS